MQKDLGFALTKLKAAIQTNELTGHNIQLNPTMLDIIAKIKSCLTLLVDNGGKGS